MRVSIGQWPFVSEISNDLTNFPPFLCLNQLCLNYADYSSPIETKCSVFMNTINSFRSFLSNAFILHFDARIVRRDETRFSSASQLIEHVKALTTCFSGINQYKFHINFWCDEEKDGFLIENLLNIPQIYRCSNVEISLFCALRATTLPVETISNWLHKDNGLKERVLCIHISDIQNAEDLYGRLKNVKSLHFYFYFKSYNFRNLNQHHHSLSPTALSLNIIRWFIPVSV